MTTIAAPLKNITLQALLPDVVRSCIIQQPSPPPDPGEEPPAPVVTEGIYTPIAPGVVYANLPVVTVVDTSPAQIIGCIITTADNPQGRLKALFPSAVNGDGVIERSTNDIWVYNGTTWNNVGPTPGPTVVTATVIPPWNEISIFDATVRTRLLVESLPYSLAQLTTVPPISTVLGLTSQSAGAFVVVPATNITFAPELPEVASGGSVAPPTATTALARFAPLVSGGASAAIPLTDFAFEASMVPYVGTRATVVQAAAGALTLIAPTPQVVSGASIAVSATDLALTAPLPAVLSKPAPTIQTGPAAASSTGIIVITGVAANQDDILLVVLENAGDSTLWTPLANSGGTFQAVTGSPVTDVATSAGSKLSMWWLRCPSTFTGGNVTIDDSGDHQLARVMVIRGCTTAGNPWDITATDTKTVASTTASAPAVTTTVGNTLVLSVVSRPDDSSSTTMFGTPANSVLGSFTDQGESGTASGNGGGFVITSGVKQAPGDTGVTSFATAPNTTNAAITIAFKP